ncbi:hypothetical protein C0J29_04775 [Mycobacterium paragordonae]|nr:hypothetical protein C0J29_04775 [Mycobacterium paragordonae]
MGVPPGPPADNPDASGDDVGAPPGPPPANPWCPIGASSDEPATPAAPSAGITGAAIVASAAAPCASAKLASGGICTPMVEADCRWSANIAVCSAELPTTRTSLGLPA